MREKLGFEIGYLGTRYGGWQRQNATACEADGDDSLQTAVETAIGKLALGERVSGTVCSGRTDKGVHAIRQMVTINVRRPRLSVNTFVEGLSRHLPEDIHLWPESVSWVPKNFDPKGGGKTYVYLLASQQHVSAEMRERVSEFAWVVDADLPSCASTARAIVKSWEGTHDFNDYSSHCENKNTTRTMYRADFQEATVDFPPFAKLCQVAHNQALWEVRLTADGFLRHMVRRLVGSLLAQINPPVGNRDPTKNSPTAAVGSPSFNSNDDHTSTHLRAREDACTEWIHNPSLNHATQPTGTLLSAPEDPFAAKGNPPSSNWDIIDNAPAPIREHTGTLLHSKEPHGIPQPLRRDNEMTHAAVHRDTCVLQPCCVGQRDRGGRTCGECTTIQRGASFNPPHRCGPRKPPKAPPCGLWLVK